MMIQLDPAVNGRVKIAGQNYQRGLLKVLYGIAGTVTVLDPFGAVLEGIHYSSLVNGTTGNPFASLAELRAFVDANCYRVRAAGPGPYYDPAAQIFFDAVEGGGDSLTSVEKSAVNQRIIDMKASGAWSRYLAYYMLVGGTTTAFAWNVIDPTKYKAVFSGSPTCNANGLVWNGVNQYADTLLIPLLTMTAYDTSMGYYSRTGNSSLTSVDCGCGDPNFEMSIAYAGNCYSYGYDTNSKITVPNSSGLGWWVQNVESSVLHRVFKNGVVFAQDTALNTSPLPNVSVKFGASNGLGIPYYSQRDCASFFLGKSLTAAQLAAEYASEQAFQTTLGRQV
jgi:hypothetical protein